MDEYLQKHLDRFRENCVVITGPRSKGRSEITSFLSRFKEQYIDLGKLSHALRYSQTLFETNLFNLFYSFDAKKTTWLVFGSEQTGNIQLPCSLIKILNSVPRIHVEENLEMRIRFILQVVSLLIIKETFYVELFNSKFRTCHVFVKIGKMLLS